MARLVLSVLALVTLLAAALPAAADDPPPAHRARRDGATVVRLGEIVVPGWIHNPGVIFVLERTRPRFTPAPLQRSFVPDILRTTRGL